jgi:hypothetical protein
MATPLEYMEMHHKAYMVGARPRLVERWTRMDPQPPDALAAGCMDFLMPLCCQRDVGALCSLARERSGQRTPDFNALFVAAMKGSDVAWPEWLLVCVCQSPAISIEYVGITASEDALFEPLSLSDEKCLPLRTPKARSADTDSSVAQCSAFGSSHLLGLRAARGSMNFAVISFHVNVPQNFAEMI